MVVTPHGIFGSLIYEAIDKLSYGRKWLGEILYWCVTLPLAFASHFVLDKIPHYDYSLTSPNMGKGFIRLGIDVLFCWCILIGFTSKKSLAVNTRDEKMLLAGIVAISPDVIVNLTKFLSIPYFSWFVDFHDRMHTSIHPGPFLGMVTQIVFVAVCYWWLTLLKRTKTESEFIPEHAI